MDTTGLQAESPNYVSVSSSQPGVNGLTRRTGPGKQKS